MPQDLEELVVCFELSKLLQHEGYKQDSKFYWIKNHNGWVVTCDSLLGSSLVRDSAAYSAPTCSELGDKLKDDHLPYFNKNAGWIIPRKYGELPVDIRYSDREQDARAKLWIVRRKIKNGEYSMEEKMDMIKAVSSDGRPSGNIDSFGYDEKNCKLRVQFKGGGIYDYIEVPKVIFESMLKAESKGKFLNANIKNRYKFYKPK